MNGPAGQRLISPSTQTEPAGHGHSPAHSSPLLTSVKSPAAHGVATHWVGELEPAAAEGRSAGQRTHAHWSALNDDHAAGRLRSVFARQGKHCTLPALGANFPASHTWQLPTSANAEQRPGAQTVHTSGLLAPGAGLSVPMGQEGS